MDGVFFRDNLYKRTADSERSDCGFQYQHVRIHREVRVLHRVQPSRSPDLVMPHLWVLEQ